MRILVLGGTRFIGHAVVEAALRNGHDVTLFNRGSDRTLFPQVARLIGDRNRPGDAARIGGQRWDAVVDISGYRPAQLRPVLDALGQDAPHYVFISTVSVYADGIGPGADETAPLLRVDESISGTDPHAYGGLKVLCEQELRSRIEGSLTVIRPTVVIGPRDYTDRFGWWVRRIAEGRVPAPPRPAQPVQLIDVQDLAAFVVRCIEHRIVGTYNAVAPREPLTLRGMIDAVVAALDMEQRLTLMDTGETQLPLVIADPANDGAFQVSGEAAYRQGLSLTPIEDTARAVLRAEPRRSSA